MNGTLIETHDNASLLDMGSYWAIIIEGPTYPSGKYVRVGQEKYIKRIWNSIRRNKKIGA
jgi:hypothetical protein